MTRKRDAENEMRRASRPRDAENESGTQAIVATDDAAARHQMRPRSLRRKGRSKRKIIVRTRVNPRSLRRQGRSERKIIVRTRVNHQRMRPSQRCPRPRRRSDV